jgi:hypothetical protein
MISDIMEEHGGGVLQKNWISRFPDSSNTTKNGIHKTQGSFEVPKEKQKQQKQKHYTIKIVDKP